MAALPDGERVVMADDRKALCVYSTRSGEVLREIRGTETRVTAMAALSSDAVVVGCSFGYMTVWDVAAGDRLYQEKSKGTVRSIVTAGPTRFLTSVREEVRVYAHTCGQDIYLLDRILPGNRAAICGLAVNEHRHNLVVAADDGSLAAVSLMSHEKLADLQTYEGASVTCVSASHRWIVAGFSGGELLLYDATSFALASSFDTVRESPIVHLSQHSDHRLLSASEDGGVCTFDLSPRSCEVGGGLVGEMMLPFKLRSLVHTAGDCVVAAGSTTLNAHRTVVYYDASVFVGARRKVPERLPARGDAGRPVAGGDEPRPTAVCAVCLDGAVTRVLVPCGHAKFCDACVVKLLRGGGGGDGTPPQCPVCRQGIESAMRIYL
jgi:Zinc finger, C3HC4 type (RING finger)